MTTFTGPHHRLPLVATHRGLIKILFNPFPSWLSCFASVY